MRPLGTELHLANTLPDLMADLGGHLALAGECWLTPGQQALALRREAQAREVIVRARILLDKIEQGLTK